MSALDLTAAIEAAHKAALKKAGVAREHRECGNACSFRYAAADAITVAAPLIERAVREQIAAAIKAEWRTTVHDPGLTGYGVGLLDAAAIALDGPR